jgi:hypothetical protein
MSGPTHSIQTTYRPVEGNGTIRITFPDVRKSSRKNADELVNKQIAKITADHPGTVITAQLERGERFASIWIYALTAEPTQPATSEPETT